MPEPDFTNREITSMFDELKTILLRVEDQTIRTNGRVTSLEKVNEKRDGAWGVVKYLGLFAAGLLVAYLVWLGKEVNSIHNTLSIYEIEII